MFFFFFLSATRRLLRRIRFSKRQLVSFALHRIHIIRFHCSEENELHNFSYNLSSPMSTCRKFEINRLPENRVASQVLSLWLSSVVDWRSCALTTRNGNRISFRIELNCTTIPYWFPIGKQAYATLLRMNVVLPIDTIWVERARARPTEFVLAYVQKFHSILFG